MTTKISATDLARYIDHTLLKADSQISGFEKLCNEAVQYNFMSVCVNSAWTKFVAQKLAGTPIKICTVVGFPLGAMDYKAKAFETRCAVENGANEIDMVINIGALKTGDLKLVEDDIAAVRNATQSDTILKVIIETSYLTTEEKIAACEIAKKVKADFVKTSTGFSSSGATVEDIELMRKVVGPQMGVKASGGITDYTKAVAMLQAGANRLGCGSSVAIITGAPAQGNY